MFTMLSRHLSTVLTLLIQLCLITHIEARGINSKVGASCLYVAANFTSFPFDCEMPDLSFKCRCQNQPFLGTVANCIENHSKDPNDLSKAYKQLVDTCDAQGGQHWTFIDLVKIHQNATSYLMDYSHLPTPKYKASLVWKAKKIQKIQDMNNMVIQSNNANGLTFESKDRNQQVVFNPYSTGTTASDNTDEDLNIAIHSEGMIKNGKVVGIEKIPSFDNMAEIEKIGVAKILHEPRFVLYNPVIVPDELYNISYTSVSKLLDQRNLATTYGLYIYLYWGCVMFIAMLVNISQWTSPYYNNRLAKTKFALWCKSKIICPQILKPNNVLEYGAVASASKTLSEMVDGPMGLFDGKGRLKVQNDQTKILSSTLLDESNHSKLVELENKLRQIEKQRKLKKVGSRSKLLKKLKDNFMASIYTMPVRMHAIVIIGYVALNVIFCCIEYEIIYPNTVFTCKKGQKFVSIADRTGIIGTVQLPLVYLFSTRNNIFGNLTGLSYRSFQMFHKWTSRVVFVLLVLHCSFFLLFVNVRGDYIDRWGLLKWRCANTAFIAVSVTIAVSFFKRFIYEFFKYTHQALIIIFSIGAWYHCITLGWIEYLVVAYVVWGMEYVVRVCKIISTGGILKGQCKVIYNNNSERMVPESIRIVINHSGWWKPYPGCYCWVKVLRPDMFWESHPFTVVSATNAKNYNQLVFVIRVKNGITKRLARYISKQSNGECSLNLLVEGPYGNNIPFKQYDKSILIAGGVGLSVIYSIAMDLAQIYRAQILRGKRESTMNDEGNDKDIVRGDKKLISLVWIVPNFESLMSFRNEIESLTNFKDVLEVQIFITKKLQDDVLQSIVMKRHVNNPLGGLTGPYESGGVKEFAEALVQSARLVRRNERFENGQYSDGSIGTHSNETNTSYAFGNTNPLSIPEGFSGPIVETVQLDDFILDTDVNKDTKQGECTTTSFIDITTHELGKAEADLEGGIQQTIGEQRSEEMKLLEWLIANNGKQISINFEDKPFLQDELTNFIQTQNEKRPISVIACGPTNLNVDVRLSVVKCLESGICVDYYEEELLW